MAKQKPSKLKRGLTRKAETTYKIISKYLKKYPKMKDYTLAKLIHDENPQHFLSIDNARSNIRFRRGHMGSRVAQDTKFVTPKNFDTTNTLIKITNRAPKLKILNLPLNIKNVLFLTDIHVPYQDDLALNKAITFGLEKNVDCIWLNGDIMDMYGASDHEKLPDHAMIHEEFDAMHDFLGQLRKLFPKAQIYYKEGNHERRWTRLLMRKAQELIGMKEFELNIILKLEEFKIHWVSNETLVKFGDLNVIHGNEFRGGGGVNPARALYMRAKANIIAGDKHKTGENIENNLNNELVTTYSVGCLCDLNPKYIPFGHTIWNVGFAYIEMKDGKAKVHNYRIHNNNIL
jgi:predicted phosphodiesterase